VRSFATKFDLTLVFDFNMAIPTYVPLIISLIALIAPVINLLRVIFETAEGYRKCSESVIGPWSKLRWRRWSWSEFRFEVHFVTPKLELQDISELRLKEDSYRAHFLTLRDRVLKKQEGGANDAMPTLVEYGHTKTWYPTPREVAARRWGFSNSAKRADALFQSGDVLDSSLVPEFDNRIIHVGRRSVLSMMRGDEEQVNAPPANHRFISDQRVSWLSFLRHLYRVQNRVASVSDLQLPSDLGPDPWASLLEKPECAKLDFVKSRHPTGVSVSFIEWTWDSLPSKATRPMATTTLGTLVIMATRLGMQWRIDLEKDAYQASGNGYSLSCTQVPEMGLVATFTAEEKDYRHSAHALVFNSPTDKFMCGIIPGASFLVDQDFYCTDDSGNTDVLKAVLNAIDSSDWLHQRLNLLEESSNRDHTRWKNILSNEITALLCEFLPYDGANDHIFSGWKEGTGGLATCSMNSPQLLDALLDYVGIGTDQSPFQSQDQNDKGHRYRSPVMKDVVDPIHKLSRLAGADKDEQTMQCSRHIFERTTLWLVAHSFDQDYHRQRLYLHLIAAHCNLSFRAWKATLDCLRNPTLGGNHSEDIPKSDKAQEEVSETQTRHVSVDGVVFRWT